MVGLTDQISKLCDQIKDEILVEYSPHERLMSERKLASRLKTTHNRVHRAIQKLAEEGVVYTKVGSGTYIHENAANTRIDKTELLSDSFNIMSNLNQSMFKFKKLKVSIPVGGSLFQQQLWKKVIDAFLEQNPFVEIDIDFTNSHDVDADIQFESIHSLIHSETKYLPLDISLLERFGFSEAELSPEICSLSKIHGEFLGIPTLRIGTGTWINKIILRDFGIDPEQIRQPGDVFKIGHQIEEASNGKIKGTNYSGYHWHAINYGFIMKRLNGKLTANWERLEQFFEETKPYINKHHLLLNIGDNAELFLNNQLAIFPQYMYNHSLYMKKDNVFSLIPYPLLNNGFTAEGMSVGCINRTCQNLEEAHLLLAFMVSKKAQQVFAENAVNWFTVRPDVLEYQKVNSPFPSGSVRYDFDIRQYFPLLDMTIDEFGHEINTETGKLFVGIQDIKTTIQKLKDQADVR